MQRILESSVRIRSRAGRKSREGSPRYERRVRGPLLPAAPTASTARLPACIPRGYLFCLAPHGNGEMLYQPLGTEQARIEFSRNFCSEPVAVIHVVITVTDLTRPAI